MNMRKIVFLAIISGSFLQAEQVPEETYLDKAYKIAKIASITTLSLVGVAVGIKAYLLLEKSSIAFSTINQVFSAAGNSLTHIDSAMQQTAAAVSAAMPAITELNTTVQRAGITLETINRTAEQCKDITTKVAENLRAKELLQTLGSKKAQAALIALFSSLFKGFSQANPSAPTPSWTDPSAVIPILAKNPAIFGALMKGYMAQRTNSAPQQVSAQARRACAIQ